MPRGGDVMVYKKDTTLGQTREFDAQIQVLDIPNEIKVGYSPIGFVRCGRSACRISKLKWKMGKETGGKKNGRPSFFEVKRNGAVQFPAAAATCLRHVQELRRPFACRIHGRKRCRDARESHLLRTERGRRQRWQEEVGFELHVQHVCGRPCIRSSITRSILGGLEPSLVDETILTVGCTTVREE